MQHGASRSIAARATPEPRSATPLSSSEISGARRAAAPSAHVTLCFLALMLVRVTERATGDTWHNVRREFERMHLGEFSGPAGRVLQRTETAPRQREILGALELREPPLLVEHETAPRPRRRAARSA